MEDAPELADGPLDWNALFGVMRTLREQHAIPESSFVVLLTSRANTENWFSAFDSLEARNVFIQTSDWDYYVPCNPEYAWAYEVIVNSLQCLVFGSLERTGDWAHDPPLGCINDLCSWKPDISLKLRTADICPDCLARYRHAEVTAELLNQALALMEMVRRNTLYSATVRRGAASDERYPFPVAFTKRKLRMTSEPLRKFLVLIDHFDSLVRTATLMAGRILLKDEFRSFAQKQELSTRPALGHWLAALQALSRIPTTQPGPDLSLPSDFRQRIELVVRKATEDGIVHLRNEKRSHGYCDCQDQGYREVFESSLPAVRLERVK
jgi:hypothetical protein